MWVQREAWALQLPLADMSSMGRTWPAGYDPGARRAGKAAEDGCLDSYRGELVKQAADSESLADKPTLLVLTACMPRVESKSVSHGRSFVLSLASRTPCTASAMHTE